MKVTLPNGETLRVQAEVRAGSDMSCDGCVLYNSEIVGACRAVNDAREARTGHRCTASGGAHGVIYVTKYPEPSKPTAPRKQSMRLYTEFGTKGMRVVVQRAVGGLCTGCALAGREYEDCKTHNDRAVRKGLLPRKRRCLNIIWRPK